MFIIAGEDLRNLNSTITINNPVEHKITLTIDYAFEVVGLPVTMQQAYDSLAKRGIAVVVGVSPTTAKVAVSSLSLVYEERVLTGSLYGSAAPKTEIPRLIDLYRTGSLKLDELLTRSYPIEEINQAYDALKSGETLRSVVTF